MSEPQPPVLPGHDFVRLLGRGGSSRVYLYKQHLGGREVAIKVMNQPAATAAEQLQFQNETNRMARLASHPAILSIYDVGVAEDKRPYLIMQYCPTDYAELVRASPLRVSRALSVGITVASAVEAAHQESIIHRDIKPANILVTEHDQTVLTDFGIAGSDSGIDESIGLTIAYAPPEILRGLTAGDERSDVYSLGATIYALLAGRPPFGTASSSTESELIGRILNAPLPPTGQPDVHPALEQVLATAMARDPANRYQSAAAFGRALQAVEAQLGFAQTAMAMKVANPEAGTSAKTATEDDDATNWRAPRSVDPEASPPPRTKTPASWDQDRLPIPGASDAIESHTIARHQSRAPGPEVVPPPTPEEVAAPEPTASGRKLVPAIAAGVIIVAVAALLLSRMGAAPTDEVAATSTTQSADPLVLGEALGRPENVTVTRVAEGGQLVAWTVEDDDVDFFQVSFTEGPDDLRAAAAVAEEPELQVETEEPICVVIEAVRDGQVSDTSTEACTR